MIGTPASSRRRNAASSSRVSFRARAPRDPSALRRRARPHLVEQHQKTLETEPEPDARRRRPAERAHQIVVTSAAADRILRAEKFRVELEDRARVVVETANQPRFDLMRYADRIEPRANRIEVGAALGGE